MLFLQQKGKQFPAGGSTTCGRQFMFFWESKSHPGGCRRLQAEPRPRNKPQTQNVAQKPHQTLLFWKYPLIHQFQHCPHPQHPSERGTRSQGDPEQDFFPGKTQSSRTGGGEPAEGEWNDKFSPASPRHLAREWNSSLPGCLIPVLRGWMMLGGAVGFPRSSQGLS